MNNIILLFGGDSCERDISIISAMQLYESIDKSRYNIIPIFLYKGRMYKVHDMNIDTFLEYRPHSHDVVSFEHGDMLEKRCLFFNKRTKIDNAILVTHGGNGEDGRLEGYLDIASIPYTAPSILASSICMDKCITKYILKALDIPYVDYVTLKNNEYINYVDIAKKLKFPIIVKPASLGSSIGVSRVYNMDSLKEAIALAFFYDDKILLEDCLEDFKEYNIALFKRDGKIVLSDIESPHAKDEVLLFDDKYLDNGKINGGCRDFPAKIDKHIKSDIEDYSKKIYNALDMKGVVRIDYIVKDDRVYLNEVNTIPGSLANYLFIEKGIKYQDLIENILKESVIDKEKRGKLISYYQSSVLKSAKNNINKLRK